MRLATVVFLIYGTIVCSSCADAGNNEFIVNDLTSSDVQSIGIIPEPSTPSDEVRSSGPLRRGPPSYSGPQCPVSLSAVTSQLGWPTSLDLLSAKKELEISEIVEDVKLSRAQFFQDARRTKNLLKVVGDSKNLYESLLSEAEETARACVSGNPGLDDAVRQIVQNIHGGLRLRSWCERDLLKGYLSTLVFRELWKVASCHAALP